MRTNSAENYTILQRLKTSEKVEE